MNAEEIMEILHQTPIPKDREHYEIFERIVETYGDHEKAMALIDAFNYGVMVEKQRERKRQKSYKTERERYIMYINKFLKNINDIKEIKLIYGLTESIWCGKGLF